ncbi:translation initiation factor 2 [Desulfovibrio sp. SGI.169]|uniref:translation initiation factor 2 n=1 Tax=Desulfovibrio sp. SGI.169 TaxID=3420561 RepID=UPI003D08748B
MRIFLAFILTLGLATGGCAWFSGSDSSDTQTPAAQPEEQAAVAAPEPAPAKAAPAKTRAKAEKAAPSRSGKASKASKGPKSEAEISAELNAVGHKLAAQAARTVMPSKASKEVRKDGKGYVASYVEVDATNLTTEMRPGAKGQYVGFIRYQEKFYECRGASKKEALSAPCQQVRARRLNELIRYDGKSWQF